MTGRLPGLRPAELDPAQRSLYDSKVANEVPWTEAGGGRAIAEDDSLLGPFNPLLFSPAIGAGLARGLPDAMIEAIATGKRPEFGHEADASAYDFTWQLTHHHAVDGATYTRAAREFGQAGMADMVVLAGLYLTVCAIVNAFNVPVPVGTRPESSAP